MTIGKRKGVLKGGVRRKKRKKKGRTQKLKADANEWKKGRGQTEKILASEIVSSAGKGCILSCDCKKVQMKKPRKMQERAPKTGEPERLVLGEKPRPKERRGREKKKKILSNTVLADWVGGLYANRVFF